MLLFLALCLATPAAAQSFRCGGQLVMEGDSAAAVLHACGAPDFRDRWVADGGFVLGPPMTEWTYNEGPRQLLQIVLFRGDRVASLGTGGYGFTERGVPPGGACRPGVIQPGMSKYRLLHTCGPPAARSGWYITSTRVREPGYTFYERENGGRFVYRERWTYNFGGNRLLRYVMLDDARVTDIVLGERGFDR